MDEVSALRSAREDLVERVKKVPRIRLANLPTPLQEMPRLTKLLKGPRLFIKRDDCTGIAFGGNKERKAEFTMADALRRKADVVITMGDALYSNHARSTAAAARKLGLEVVLVLIGEKPTSYDGNELIDYLLGADMRFISKRQHEGVDKDPMGRTARELSRQGHTPYVIPVGASYPVGAIAYVDAMLELMGQAQNQDVKIDCVVHAAGSGGTQAGLVLGGKVLKSGITIYGISAEPDCELLTKKTIEIANGAAGLLGLESSVNSGDVTLTAEYSGEEYGVITPGACEAIKLLAKTEGILLDPVYTGKAMAGLINLIRQDHFSKDQNLVFIHTGGTLALFRYKKELTRSSVRFENKNG